MTACPRLKRFGLRREGSGRHLLWSAPSYRSTLKKMSNGDAHAADSKIDLLDLTAAPISCPSTTARCLYALSPYSGRLGKSGPKVRANGASRIAPRLGACLTARAPTDQQRGPRPSHRRRGPFELAAAKTAPGTGVLGKVRRWNGQGQAGLGRKPISAIAAGRVSVVATLICPVIAPG